MKAISQSASYIPLPPRYQGAGAWQILIVLEGHGTCQVLFGRIFVILYVSAGYKKGNRLQQHKVFTIARICISLFVTMLDNL